MAATNRPKAEVLMAIYIASCSDALVAPDGCLLIQRREPLPGLLSEPDDIAKVRLEAYKARELMKEMQWKS